MKELERLCDLEIRAYAHKLRIGIFFYFELKSVVTKSIDH